MTSIEKSKELNKEKNVIDENHEDFRLFGLNLKSFSIAFGGGPREGIVD